MKTRYIILIATILLYLVSSCQTTEKIDDFPLRPSKLVLNSYFTPDSAWEVQVSKSLSVLDNADIKLLNDASIRIYKNDVLLDTLNQSDGYGWYRSSRTVPEPGNKYSIEVTSPKYKTPVTAEEVLVDAVPITDLKVTIIDSSFYRDYWYDEFGNRQGQVWGNVEGSIDVTISDPAGTDNYYQLSVYTYNTWIDYIYNPDNPGESDTAVRINREEIRFSTDDPVADDSDDYMTKLHFNDNIIDGETYQIKLKFDDWNASFDREYYVELISMNKAGYLYRKSVKEYQNSSGDPFSEPVLIYSNIENGYGIFAGYSTNYNRVRLFDN